MGHGKLLFHTELLLFYCLHSLIRALFLPFLSPVFFPPLSAWGSFHILAALIVHPLPTHGCR